jgi:CheY-like chemotaxis protein
MPVMDGIESTKEIYNLYNNGEIQTLPYIACLTAYIGDDIKK